MQKHEGGIASICSFVLPNLHSSLLYLAVLFITTKKQCLEKATVEASARIPGMRTPSYISAPGEDTPGFGSRAGEWELLSRVTSLGALCEGLLFQRDFY